MYGKVVCPDIWHSKGAEAKRQARKLGGPVLVTDAKEECVAELDLLFYKQERRNVLLIQEALTCGGGMVAHLATVMIGFSISARQIELRRSTFKATPLEGLCHNLIASKAFQWERRPLYYGAVLREIQERTIELEKVTFQSTDQNSS